MQAAIAGYTPAIGWPHGVFELDRRSGEQHKAGVRVKLAHQPFRILERGGDLVTRKELTSQL